MFFPEANTMTSLSFVCFFFFFAHFYLEIHVMVHIFWFDDHMTERIAGPHICHGSLSILMHGGSEKSKICVILNVVLFYVQWTAVGCWFCLLLSSSLGFESVHVHGTPFALHSWSRVNLVFASLLWTLVYTLNTLFFPPHFFLKFWNFNHLYPKFPVWCAYIYRYIYIYINIYIYIYMLDRLSRKMNNPADFSMIRGCGVFWVLINQLRTWIRVFIFIYFLKKYAREPDRKKTCNGTIFIQNLKSLIIQYKKLLPHHNVNS